MELADVGLVVAAAVADESAVVVADAAVAGAESELEVRQQLHSCQDYALAI